MDIASHGNEQYLNTPERKEKMSKLRTKVRQTEKQLRNAIKNLSVQESESVDEQLHGDLLGIMNENNENVSKSFPDGSFARLFWDKQLKAASSVKATQIHWHPLMIK